MKTARFDGRGGFEIHDLPKPTLEKEDILVKTAICGVCGTDVHKAVFGTVPAGTVLGHEVTGTVVETGSLETNFKPGDRVVVAHHVPCFHCRFCQRGQYSLCSHYTKTNLDPGGFSEYFRASGEHVRHTMRKLPTNMSFYDSYLMEPLACTIQGQRRAGITPGDRVLILGAGPIGLLHTQLAKINRAGFVLVSDIASWRRNVACQLGADYAIDPESQNVVEITRQYTDELGADVVIICAGVSSLLVDAVHAVRRGGTILLFADVSDYEVIAPNRLFRDEVTITGSYSSSPYDYDFAIQMLSQGRINSGVLNSKVYPLEQLGDAIAMAYHPQEDILKVLVNLTFEH